jgi:hypothetical protein
MKSNKAKRAGHRDYADDRLSTGGFNLEKLGVIVQGSPARILFS